MSEQRLIDANKVETGFDELCQSPYFKNDVSAKHGAETLMDLCVRSDSHKPNTIDPETLPIVRELREELNNERKICDDLQRELVQVSKERDEARRDCAVAESNHSECLAQLAEARVQLKSAITDMEALMWHSGDGCNICKHCVEVHREPYLRLDCDLGGGCECKPEWRGVAP